VQQLGGPPDLLLIHNSCGSLDDSVAAYKVLEQALAQGKARAIGVSNFNASEIEALVARTSILPAFNQCGFAVGRSNMPPRVYDAERDPLGDAWLKGGEVATLRKCQALGITYGAYGPLGQTTGVDVLHNSVVVDIAADRGVTPAQVGLRWVTQQGIVATTGGSNPVHLADDLRSFDFKLTDEEMRRLAAVPYVSAG